jgi:hypothetical protein
MQRYRFGDFELDVADRNPNRVSRHGAVREHPSSRALAGLSADAEAAHRAARCSGPRERSPTGLRVIKTHFPLRRLRFPAGADALALVDTLVASEHGVATLHS